MSCLARNLVSVAVALAVCLGTGLTMDYRRASSAPLGNTQDVVLQVTKGQGVQHVAAELERQGLIAKPHWFLLLAYLSGSASRIKYGEYLLHPGAKPVDVLSMLAAGRVRQYPFSIIEGWTFKQLRDALDAEPVLDHRSLGKSVDELMAAIGAVGVHPEGRFFPDTYHVTRGSSDIDLLRRAKERMDAVLRREWSMRQSGLPFSSPDQALVLASIVEKETSRPEERTMVAGVFTRRLQKGMRLQADPTVIYGMGDDYHGNITRQDLMRPTPYNTYRRNGLPPTPIAMPGLGAIRATLQPAGGDALYFVARGDGSHLFSAELGDHERAVTVYQRGARDESR